MQYCGIGIVLMPVRIRIQLSILMQIQNRIRIQICILIQPQVLHTLENQKKFIIIFIQTSASLRTVS